MASEAPNTGFSQPDTFKADFGYWAKMANWSDNELAALILGINPAHAVNDINCDPVTCRMPNMTA